MTADQANCLLLPPTFAASVLCVVVYVFVVAKYFVGVGLEYVLYGRKHVKHMEQSATSPFIILVQCATVNKLCVCPAGSVLSVR